ncbi:MAG: GNAT family N-acetyltransferase [Steroidobacteraceae bacterium]
MKTTVILGPARMGEAARIAGMSRALIEPGLPWSWTPRRVAAHMRQRDNMVVTARTDKDLVGFAMAHFGDDSVHVTLLAVAESAQRQGVGRQLLDWIEESAVTAGVFMVELELRAGNSGAKQFYGRLGYRETLRVPRYYSGIEDAIRMARNLRVAG